MSYPATNGERRGASRRQDSEPLTTRDLRCRVSRRRAGQGHSRIGGRPAGRGTVRDERSEARRFPRQDSEPLTTRDLRCRVSRRRAGQAHSRIGGRPAGRGTVRDERSEARRFPPAGLGTAGNAQRALPRFPQACRASPLAQRVGAPGRTRTCDPRLRRPMLYPTELRARVVFSNALRNVRVAEPGSRCAGFAATRPPATEAADGRRSTGASALAGREPARRPFPVRRGRQPAGRTPSSRWRRGLMQRVGRQSRASRETARLPPDHPVRRATSSRPAAIVWRLSFMDLLTLRTHPADRLGIVRKTGPDDRPSAVFMP